MGNLNLTEKLIADRFARIWGNDPQLWQDAVSSCAALLENEFGISAKQCVDQIDTLRQALYPLADRFEQELNMPKNSGIVPLSIVAFLVGLEFIVTLYGTIQLADEAMIDDCLKELGLSFKDDVV